MTRMTRTLGLSAQQQDRIRPILMGMFREMRSLVQDRSLAQDQKAQRAGSIRDAAHARIKAQLTPAQRKKYDAEFSTRRPAPKGKPVAKPRPK